MYEFKSRRGKNKKLIAQKYISNAFFFTFQTYIIFTINLLSQGTLRCSGTNILYGCRLISCLHKLFYFLESVYWILHYPMQYIKHCWVRLLSNYNIEYICTTYTSLYTYIMSISRFSFRDKVTLWLLKLHLYGADVVEWSSALEIRLNDLRCSTSMVWGQNTSREKQNIDSSKIYV